MTKDTWDDKKDFPSSFVHDNRSNSRKDNLDQTHEHWSKVTVLRKKNTQKNKLTTAHEKPLKKKCTITGMSDLWISIHMYSFTSLPDIQ